MSDASVREECAAILEMPIANQVPRETVRRIARAYLELLDKSQWQPIETAPKDGTPLLLCATGADVRPLIVIANWGCRVDFTHWMPLPDPPEAK